MKRLRTVVAASIVVLAASLAHAYQFPPDAEFIVTDAQGVIVAVGRTVGGRSALVEVWSGFAGPARLTVFHEDGSIHAIDVAVEDGVVALDGIDLRVLLAAAFEDVVVRFVAELDEAADPWGGGEGRADDVEDREPPGQDRRPEEPPGQERRPEEPPGQERRPEEPPGQDRRPEEPPGQSRRPE